MWAPEALRVKISIEPPFKGTDSQLLHQSWDQHDFICTYQVRQIYLGTLNLEDIRILVLRVPHLRPNLFGAKD